MPRVTLLLALLAGTFAACDSHAKVSDVEGGRADQKSREFESCAASFQCADDLRCFAQVCRKTTRLVVADYYAALGAVLRGKGNTDGAIAAYHEAVTRYDAEKIAQPPEIDCAYGATLASDKANKEHAELGARVLHRCIAALPAGSPLRDRALADIATLADVGFEPQTLNHSQPADLYLTRQPARPSPDKLSVTTAATPPIGKSGLAIADRFAADDLHPALAACWDAYTKATSKDTLVVTFGIKAGISDSGYDDEPGSYFLKLDPPAAGTTGPDAAAEACVRAVIEPALKNLTSVRDSFATRLSVTIK